MRRKASLGTRLLTSGLVRYARVDRRILALLSGVRGAAAGMMAEALSSEEQAEVTLALYGRSLGTSGGRTELFEWERAWFERRLPPPPARVLVGGAGCGRELRFLRGAGYAVDALEPLPEGARRCAECADAVFELSYEDLAHAVLDEREKGSAELGLAARRYEAVILGWGSFHHVLDAAERERVLSACGRLTPEGPILASYWPFVPEQRGRQERLARALGRAVGRLRGIATDDAQLAFTWSGGFGHAFTHAELEQLAQRIGRTCCWEPDPGYAHVTFLPGSLSK